jgi:glycosyltransferase involved in cell wall biosynthesis
MISQDPKISIVIPSLNKVGYIGETLLSIFSQRYSNLEVIIQDGGSTDGTLDIIKKFAGKYPKMVRWESKRDKGQLDAINKGMKKTSGQILTYINADDCYTKDAFRKVANAFRGTPKSLWFAGGGAVINAKGKVIAKLATCYKNFLLFLNRRPLLLMTNYLVQPSVFITQGAYQKYGPFVGTREFVLEYDLWLKIGKSEMPRVLTGKLANFRIFKNTISTTLFSKVLKEDYGVVRRYTNNPIILFMHSLHNWIRMTVVGVIA